MVALIGITVIMLIAFIAVMWAILSDFPKKGESDRTDYIVFMAIAIITFVITPTIGWLMYFSQN